MITENTPWLFTPALFYVFVIVALFSVEIVKKALIPLKWKIRTALLGIMPLLLALIIAVFSMAGEMLYLLPEYASGQQEFMQFVDTSYGYNNNLLIMIPMGLFYFIVLSVSQNKKFLFGVNKSSKNRNQMKQTGDSIQSTREKDLDREREELKRKDDEWLDVCAIDDNYWNNWSNP